MQEELHPEMKDVTVHCACGEEFKTKSTREDIRVEVCSNCHPFYTGKTRKAAKGGRIERFNEKYGLSGDEAGETAEVTENEDAEEASEAVAEAGEEEKEE